ncbi:hypothetical protein [Candidatus Endomicrobiellum devescovinae]|jgi:hypothetical protein|uniref:hypothetical protein n=1 Tax=Candidatus Endomicrobiellum devescovinae TaxID=3242322 RepID=UPI002833AD4D|nr:hypothetical protein [Endomicrobium sp.]
MDINSVEKMLKTNKTKLNAITGARLEHEKETSASDVADRILPFLKMPSAQEIALHPWLAGSVSVLESILAAKLMKNVSEEKKRNRNKAVELLNKEEEEEGKSEKERLIALTNKLMGYHETKETLAQEQAKANIAKAYQDIEESKGKFPLGMKQIEYKNQKEAAKATKDAEDKSYKESQDRTANQMQQVKALHGKVSEAVEQHMLAAAAKGEFDIKNYRERAKNVWDGKPIVQGWFGTGKDRYGLAVKKAEENKAEDKKEGNSGWVIQTVEDEKTGKIYKRKYNKITGESERL